MNTRRIFANFTIGVLLTALSGCAEEAFDEQESDVVEANQSIENGTVHTLADATIAKNVRMERPDGSTLGSGALLRNNWVLTAAHLFPATRIASPSTTLQVRLADQVLTAAEIFIAPNTLDVALVRLSNGFLIDGKRTGFNRPLHTGTPASLVGQTLDCWGFGANAPNGTSAGTLRQAALKVVESGSGWVGIERNALGQLMTTGDSGGVCFWNGQAIGVHNYRYQSVNGVYLRGYETHSSSFRDWAITQVMDRKAATMHRVTMTCAGTAQGSEQVRSLSDGYSNYTCNSRYQQQCIDDGSADSYYMEWCDYSGVACRLVAPGRYFCDPGASPTASGCKATKVFRTAYSCNGQQQSGEQVIDLASGYSNYTCGNRFVAQCVSDGSYDTYWNESCEYTCQ